MAERAGLENRRWGNPSASSNLAPSAISSRIILGIPAEIVLAAREIQAMEAKKGLVSESVPCAAVGMAEAEQTITAPFGIMVRFI